MRARVWALRRFWVAVSAHRGWPAQRLRAWLRPNEHTRQVWHVGIIALGACVELRVGWGVH